MRIAELVAKKTTTKYARAPLAPPDPFAHLVAKTPCGCPHGPDGDFPDPFAGGIETGEIRAFCDQYRARLIHTPIVTRDRKGKPGTRTSGNDRAVLKALCLLMEKEKSACFAAPEAAVATLAHCAENTAGSTMRRLINAGYLIRHPLRSYGCGLTYTLLIDKLEKLPDDAPRISDLTGIEAVVTGDLRDESFHAKNLGRATLEVYEQLLKMSPSRVNAIAAEIDKGESNVSAHLKKLERVGMARRVGWLWEVVTTRIKRDDDLYQASHKLGLERSDRKAAHELRRQNELDELNQTLTFYEDDSEWEPDDADDRRERIGELKEEIALVQAESAKYNRKTRWTKDMRADFEKNVEARFRAHLERRGITRQEAINDATGGREAGRVAPSVVVTWMRLQREKQIDAEHENAKK